MKVSRVLISLTRIHKLIRINVHVIPRKPRLEGEKMGQRVLVSWMVDPFGALFVTVHGPFSVLRGKRREKRKREEGERAAREIPGQLDAWRVEGKKVDRK